MSEDVLARMQRCKFPELTFCGDAVTVAEAIQEIASLRARLKAADDSLRQLREQAEVARMAGEDADRMERVVEAAVALRDGGMGVEFDDERLDYVTIQVDRDALAAFKSALAAHDEAKRQPAAAAIPAETEQQKWDRVHWGGEEP